MNRSSFLSHGLLAAGFFAAVAAAGCGDGTALRPGDVRTYTVAKGAPAAAPPRESAGPPPAASPVRYDVPAGWQDQGASGMRLTTLLIVLGLAEKRRAKVRTDGRRLDAG